MTPDSTPVTAAALHATWRMLPVAGLDDIIGPQPCLVLAPHPDDESLGCGGLIAACVEAGRPPVVAILTDGAASHPGSAEYPPARLRDVRRREAVAAVAQLGLAPGRLVFLDQPDSAAPHEGASLEAVADALLPHMTGIGTILAPWRHDPHCDHQAASKLAAHVAARTGVRHVAYPVWGWMLPSEQRLPDEPSDGWRLNIARFLPAKRAAIAAHRSQHGGLISDGPSGFSLPSGLLSVFDQPFETFLAT